MASPAGVQVWSEPWNGDGQRWEHVHYEVRYDFTIRVPRDAALRLCTINGGDVIVTGTQANFDVSNVNGLIDMKNVAGSGRAHTVNGPITVTFTANPTQASSFKTVNGNVNAMIVPGSGIVKQQAEAEGLDKIFIKAGFEWREPGCSMCLAMNPDKLMPEERCASTSNRNFEGRQGFKGRTHLVSPAMAAAAAIAGHFVDIREWR